MTVIYNNNNNNVLLLLLLLDDVIGLKNLGGTKKHNYFISRPSIAAGKYHTHNTSFLHHRYS